MEKFDAIIIGSGQAGNPLAKRLAAEGRRVALVELACIGGTCINWGCTPTKTLVGIAKNVFQARGAAKYGMPLKKHTPDFELVMQRVNHVVSHFREGLENALRQTPNLTCYHGKARFAGYKEVRVQLADGRFTAMTAELIFINTGARARVPDLEGLPAVNFLTSATALALKQQPNHLIIVGGGYVSLEFSQIFRRLGSQVTILEKSSGLLPKEDEDVGLLLTRMLEGEGVEIRTDATITRVSAGAQESVQLEILSAGKSSTLQGTHLLVATGRIPNTEELGLEKTGIRLDGKGYIPVNSHLETSQAGIYALGDVKGGPAFTHVSYHDYVVVADHLFDQQASPPHNRLLPYCIFTDPELGRIGLTEKEAGEMGLDFSVTKMNTSAIARAVETGETTGFVKALVDNKSRKILGVAVISAGGGELMSLFQIAMQGGLTYDQLRDTMFAHPTYAEAINNLFSPEHLQPGIPS
ncbi:mercuric reductase [Pontibacter liquoris]|uniref:mercuric reductase n=1 Tax=Pontibacter liquoris TaxID=2905677 RepID=UPI001FA6BB9D